MFWAPPCCNYSDPWPDPGPVCGDMKVASCPAGESCGSYSSIELRYRDCINYKSSALYVSGPRTTEFLRLLCPGSEPKKPGDACQDNDDCRPAAETVSEALACDATTKQCAVTPRPAAPADYQQPCDLPSGFTPGVGEQINQVTVGTATVLCHTWRSMTAGEVHQPGANHRLRLRRRLPGRQRLPLRLDEQG